MAQTNRDGERRASILRLTLDGLEADLDDLRDDLLDSLEQYEGELRDASESLPEWLAVQPASIRELFQLPTDGQRAAGVLGPRTVALAAASVEEFITSWLARAPDALDEDGAEEYERAYSAAIEEIDGYETFARHAARDARETLGDWLDGILTELEDTRERDEAALRQLVSEGAIEKGRNAREEIAALWEDQRERAADVRERWGRLEEHTFRGLEQTLDGLQELRSMMTRADDGVRGAFETLESRSEPSDGPVDGVDAPGGGTLTGMQRDPSEEGIDTARRETLELDRDEPIDEVARTFLRVSPSEVSEVSEDEAIDEAGDTLVDDVGETAPIDTTELEELARESSVSEEDDLAEEEAHEVETVEMDREPVHSDFGDDSQEDDAEKPEEPIIAHDPEPEPEPDPEPEPAQPVTAGASDQDERSTEVIPDESEPGPTSEPDFEPVLTDAIRILDRFVKVSLPEIFVVLGPPVAAFVFLIVQTTSARSGAGVDPIRETPWGLIVFATAAVWLLLAPLIAQWQFRFNGVVPRFVRRAEVVEEADVEVDSAGLSIGGETIPWAGADIIPARWESKPDGSFGWSLVVRRGRREHVLAAAERNFTQWERSNLPVDEDIDHDAWQVEERVIRSVRQATGQ